MRLINKTFICLLSLTLVGCSTNVLNSNRQAFINSLQDDALVMITRGEDAGACNDYKNNNVTYTDNNNLPDSYDLRQVGLVTSVKDQGQLGTCWAHALVSASETSALKSLNLTNDQYISKYGKEINFSEKAFTYYGLTQIENTNEGFVYLQDGDLSIYNGGSNEKGIMGFVGNGIEIYDEEKFPYLDSNGDIDYGGVWTLDEDGRYDTIYSIDEVNILPSPATIDDEGNYTLNIDALNIMKQEICNGNAIIVSYHADATVSPLSYDEAKSRLWDILKNDYNMSDEDADYYVRFRAGIIDTHSLELDKIIELIKFRLMINNFDDDLYDLTKYSKDDLAYLLGSEYFGQDADLVIEYEKSLPYYMHQDPNNNIYCHYTYDNILSNHMVTIVGYDDKYSASNFTDGHEPDGDGAFIVKNSWSDKWANNGYFYLSYYDKSIQAPTIVSVSSKQCDYDVLCNDYAQFLDVSSALLNNKALEANIVDVSKDSSLYALGFYTDNLDTNVDISVYKLNDNYTKPTDGKLLVNVSNNYKYSGYHRIYLDDVIDVNANDKLAIVISQKVNNKYALLATYGFNYDYLVGISEDNIGYELNLISYPERYVETIVNTNESYISYDGKTWLDWSEELNNIVNESDILKYIAIENLPAKIYLTN